MNTYKTVDEYIENYSGAVRQALETIRHGIKQAYPDVTEVISYGIPTYKRGKHRVHFGGYETHIGLYPSADVIQQLADDLASYDTSKGTIRFQINDAIPYKLIQRVVEASLSDK